ncbi:MAG: ribosomal protein S18-alanine N-acetyltransferase [Acidobacteria bacterium]|nr:ribosomal protein S18-alanine N-acetyltransferase [Acidobacteriota bacterium]
MEVIITSMLTEHIPSVVELERQCQLSTRGEDGYARLISEMNSVLLVAVSEGLKVIGCLSGWLVADEFEIDNVAVSTDWRKSGVGSKLLSAAIEIARQKKANQAFLEVRSNNQAACSLYEKYGFVPVGRRKNYYRAPEGDALIFWLKIVG